MAPPTGPVSEPVYTFSLDKGQQSACHGMCAMYWSPVLTSMSPEAGPGVDQHQLGTIARPDGTHQVTFDGHPLYMFHTDASPIAPHRRIPRPHQRAGQGFRGSLAGGAALVNDAERAKRWRPTRPADGEVRRHDGELQR